MILDRWYVGLWLVVLLLFGTIYALEQQPVQAAPSEPEICEHVATAATIEIYFCEDIDLFVNQLGFMLFEP